MATPVTIATSHWIVPVVPEGASEGYPFKRHALPQVLLRLKFSSSPDTSGDTIKTKSRLYNIASRKRQAE